MKLISLNKFPFLLFFLLLLISTNTYAQYPSGYARYQRDWEAKRQIRSAEELEEFYRKNVVMDSAIRFEVKNSANSNTENLSGIPLNCIKAQKEIIVPKGYTLKTSTVYFTGYGFAIPYVYTIANNSLSQIDSFINKFGIGSTMVFDATWLVDESGKEFPAAPASYVVRSDDEKTASPNPAYTELLEMFKIEFTRGTIYFSGSGYPVPLSIPAKEINSIKGKDVSSKAQPGTSVSFDNCNYFNKATKTAVVVNKIIKL